MATAHEAIVHLQESAGAEFIAFGASRLVESFGVYEAEYAAIRKGVGIFHEPQRGILRFTGKDVADFLHRMLTQDIRGMTGGSTRRAFQLNEKGRIIADVIVHHGDQDTWLDGDDCDLPALAKLYDARLFGEDVTIEHFTPTRTCFALHGPQALDLLRAVGAAPHDNPPLGTHHVLDLAGDQVSAYRHDICGVPGLRLWAKVEHAAKLYAALAEACGGLAPNVEADAAGGGAKRAIKGRGIGWLAFNTARLEAGQPLYHVDFGPDTLPHETGLLGDAVSFTKGCYLGQEIVARMHNLGHPKRVLARLKVLPPNEAALPIAGSQIFDADGATVIGAVTSSTLSPLRGNGAIALGMLKWGKHRAETRVRLPAEGRLVDAEVETIAVAGAAAGASAAQPSPTPRPR